MKFIKKCVNVSGQTISADIAASVSEILSDVKNNGDAAVLKYNKMFDNYEGGVTQISGREIADAYKKVSCKTIDSIKAAAENIKLFAKTQKSMLNNIEAEISPGVRLGHNVIPVESCGCYVPGGNYPLPSSALMSVIPASVAGVKRIAACSPPSGEHGGIHPATLVAMDIAGAHEIYCMGGAQSIGALAFGTSSVKSVCLIVGPGNKYVTEAKKQVYGTVNIDFLAGPSEVFIIADESANTDFIAADLLAQCEHDINARGLLVCTSEKTAYNVLDKIHYYLDKIDTKQAAAVSWENNGQIIVCDRLEEAVAIANDTAPEHLELHVLDADSIKSGLRNYGSLFIGSYSAEVFGDYISGTNHILPTFKAAKYTGGLWVGTFLKIVTYQTITKDGAKNIGYAASTLAETEGLSAHKLAADLRCGAKI